LSPTIFATEQRPNNKPKKKTRQMKRLYFDIETGPADDAVQFEPTFEASKVLKDPVKIAADIADKRAAWWDRLALSALTGQVLAIGWAGDDGEVTVITQTSTVDEADVIRAFWNATTTAETLVGFNSNAFDLPFLWRRSIKLGIRIPDGIFEPNRRLFSTNIDLMERWCWFDSQARVSLDNLAKFFGFPPKKGSGKHFAELMRENIEEAVEYLIHDVEITQAIGRRMGV
jgi:predicted PolB exonuclease-like 3'-5' exonuclease